jgi:hypothetical protein
LGKQRGGSIRYGSIKEWQGYLIEQGEFTMVDAYACSMIECRVVSGVLRKSSREYNRVHTKGKPLHLGLYLSTDEGKREGDGLTVSLREPVGLEIVDVTILASEVVVLNQVAQLAW